jgi:hypothetical protein
VYHAAHFPATQVQNSFKTITSFIAALLCIGLGIPSSVAEDPNQASPVQQKELVFHSVVPLGVELLRLEPSKQAVGLIVSATSPAFDGMKRIGERWPIRLVSASGKKVKAFPPDVVFRVTATSRDRGLDGDANAVKWDKDLNSYLLGFRFELKAFHGISSKIVQPQAVEMIGMPADITYDERIYLARFDLSQFPVDDRLVFEVFDPNGTRVARFHLELE